MYSIRDVQQLRCTGSEEMLKIVVGSSVEGDNFYGRTDELATLERMVEMDHVLLLAPRRVGKSSLMRAMAARPVTGGRVPVFVDVQDGKTEADFVRAVSDAV